MEGVVIDIIEPLISLPVILEVDGLSLTVWNLNGTVPSVGSVVPAELTRDIRSAHHLPRSGIRLVAEV